MTAPVRVASASALADDTAVLVEVDGKPVCLAKSGGTIYAVADRCSHADVSLSEGLVDDATVECWLHGSRFDLTDGTALTLPATRPVATFAVIVEGDDVLVRPEPIQSKRS